MEEASIQLKSIDRVENAIKITFQDDHECLFPAEFLREKCPCAVCKETPGHAAPQPVASKGVTVKAAETMGWYAIKFTFSDGHDTGIYSFEYLRQICPEAPQ